MNRTQRRVQALVILLIAVFVLGGFAANRYVTAAHSRTPADAPLSPADDAVIPPTPEGSRQPAPTPTAKRHRIRHSARPMTAGATVHVTAATPKRLSAEETALRLTNKQRTRHGCAPLRMDPRLRTAARRHSADMRDRHYFDHDSRDGTTPWNRIKALGYSVPGAENIAMRYPTAQAVLKGWMASPGHRANILNCTLKAVGIGVVYGQGGPWWTQDFGFR